MAFRAAGRFCSKEDLRLSVTSIVAGGDVAIYSLREVIQRFSHLYVTFFQRRNPFSVTRLLLIGMGQAFVGTSLSFVGKSLSFVGTSLSFVGTSLSFFIFKLAQ